MRIFYYFVIVVLLCNVVSAQTLKIMTLDYTDQIDRSGVKWNELASFLINQTPELNYSRVYVVVTPHMSEIYGSMLCDCSNCSRWVEIRLNGFNDRSLRSLERTFFHEQYHAEFGSSEVLANSFAEQKVEEMV